jgi:solute carrier family 10 (sodium/bile acid cotransporter), member 7
MARLLSFLKSNIFILCLLGSIVLAWLFPYWGSHESPLHLSTLCTYGVSIIFFFYGLRLSPVQMKAGLVNWKLHFLIQGTTFVIFPLLLLVVNKFFASGDSSTLWLGVFYLAALPSTVSSSVVMVSIAGGNMPAAIFNASISSILGIFVTPLWMSSWIDSDDAGGGVADTILKLCLQILLPVVLGFLLHGKLGQWSGRYRTVLRNFDQLIILLIVYTSFCESFSQSMFSDLSVTSLLFLGLMMVLLFTVIFSLVNLITTQLGFNREDRLTALFCGSKKSLVQGAVMGKVLFPNQAVLGIVLLPLMLYHALQLILGSAIAHRMRRRTMSDN